MKEKKDFDVSFNTTLSDVSCTNKDISNFLDFHKDEIMKFLGIKIFISREKEVEA